MSTTTPAAFRAALQAEEGERMKELFLLAAGVLWIWLWQLVAWRDGIREGYRRAEAEHNNEGTL